jgi:hypothetical protein
MWYNCRRNEISGKGSAMSVPLGRKNVLDKNHLGSDASAAERENSTRRIFSGAERRYLSLEARSMAYGLLDSQSVPPGVTESAVQQAVALGSISGAEIDAQTFEALFHAIALNPSFKIPFWFASAVVPSNAWVC